MQYVDRGGMQRNIRKRMERDLLAFIFGERVEFWN